MFLFGHIGITIGIVYLLASLFSDGKNTDNPRTLSIEDIDFRIVIIAAILPDIIDKFVGLIILKEEISNGRLFTHTLLVVGIISVCLFIAAKIKFGHRLKTLYYVSPLWIHLLLDRMWEDTHTLFWPLYGTSFPRLDIEFSDFFTALMTDPYTYVGEILGISIIVFLFHRHRLFIRRHFYSFLKDGKLKIRSNS